MNQLDTLRILGLITEALEQVGVQYRVGGSVASSMLGIPRSTLDIDIVADLKPAHIVPLANLLDKEFYFDQEHALESVQKRSSFNLLHFETGIKVDLFVPKLKAFDQSAFSRQTSLVLHDLESPQKVIFATAEDVILHKLQWFEMGGRGSERQWNDILGVIRTQGSALDLEYMRHWAAELGLGGLLEDALREAEAV